MERLMKLLGIGKKEGQFRTIDGRVVFIGGPGSGGGSSAGGGLEGGIVGNTEGQGIPGSSPGTEEVYKTTVYGKNKTATTVIEKNSRTGKYRYVVPEYGDTSKWGYETQALAFSYGSRRALAHMKKGQQ